MRNKIRSLTILLFLSFVIFSCNRNNTPKPMGYFRIDFPEKKYKLFDTTCPFTFEYPVYGSVEKVQLQVGDNYWYNLSFPKYNAKIHLTYKAVNNNLTQFIEDIHTIAYKHVIKADDIRETPIIYKEHNVFGVIYDFSGNTASAVNFFLTDSSKHFLSGALYFSATPNADSLFPCIDFFRQDVVHLTESLKWK